MEQPKATVRAIDGQPVLDDPSALALITVVDKRNCKRVLDVQADRVAHFVRRIAEKGLSPKDVVIVLLNVDDVSGGRLAEILMPGANWQDIRDAGEVPFARGLVERPALQTLVEMLDAEEGKKLREITEEAAVVVMDFGVVAVFKAGECCPLAQGVLSK